MSETTKIEFCCSPALKKKIKAAAKKAKIDSVSEWIREALTAATKKK